MFDHIFCGVIFVLGLRFERPGQDVKLHLLPVVSGALENRPTASARKQGIKGDQTTFFS